MSKFHRKSFLLSLKITRNPILIQNRKIDSKMLIKNPNKIVFVMFYGVFDPGCTGLDF